LIVIERDGKTIVITGWRAWVAVAVAVVVTTVVLAALAFLVLGIAVSMVGFLLIVMPAVAIVVIQGTQEMQQACTPDVTRLCNDDVPDTDRITVCLKRNRANLSAACGAALGGRGRHRPSAIQHTAGQFLS
jgi:hypothetical protein